ncbi:ATP-binding protein [Actinoplanes subtropicus]|uniref:ATP-binding protein n=1 Tax=Actinoplanes subtropicus TaxID=543632 RepID=UPI0004C4083A|nr:LuxR C-terminal-related transcriptional regulator [Actinoplanes subtropicus]
MGPTLRRSNLPAELSDFVGRRREVAELKRLLGAGRLVTLTGPGGVGKTRLALQVARQLRAYPDGTWLVELAAVTEPDLVASCVAGVLGVRDRAATSVLASLAEYLRDKQTLLVLDDCEHLLDECAVLAGKLLAAAPGLRVLVTSRQPLRLEGEWVLSLPPLSLPDLESLPPGNLSEFEAVQLLVQRAGAVLPTFEVTAANRTAIAAICRRLDGLPLALELAAARLRVLSAEELLSRLDDQPQALQAGARAGPRGRRTLRSALDWSYGLCSPRERVMWAESSVFAGGFDLAAAEQVCVGAGIDPGEVFDLVAGLVDKSILVREPEPGEAARYGLLETVRQYGRRILAESGQDDALVRRHRSYYRELVVRADAAFMSSDQVGWLLRLRREHANVRAAVQSALAEPGAAHEALQIAVAARDLWYGTGRYREGLHWTTRALEHAPDPTALRGVALAEAGYAALRLGDTVAGERMLAEARLLDRRLGDPALHVCVAHFTGVAALTSRPPDLARAVDLLEDGLAAARACGDLRRVANSLLSLAAVAGLVGDGRAAEHAEQCRALCETHQATWTRSWANAVLALAAWTDGDGERAEALVREALPTIRLLRDSWGAGICLAVLAWTASAAGRHERAARLLGACEAIKRRDGAALAEQGSYAEHHDRCIREVRGGLGEAGYAAAFAEASRYTLDEAADFAMGATAPPHRSSGPGLLTRREYQIAELIAEGMTNRDIAARLVISRRTAESHAQHILAKLGFTTRAQIARWVSDQGR